MGAEAVALPAGFKLDEPSSPAPVATLPTGFKLDAPEQSFGDRFMQAAKPFLAMPEATASLASGAVAGPLAGYAGMVGAALPGPEGQGANWAGKVQEAMTYQPRTTGGQMLTGAVSAPFEALAKGADIAGESVSNATGSPLLGAATNTAIQAVPMAVGKLVPKVGSALKPETKPAVKAAMDAGFKATPEEAGAGGIQKAVASVAGEPRLARNLTQKNSALVNDKIAADLDLPKGTQLTREVLEQVREKNGSAYETIRQSGKVDIDRPFLKDLGESVKDLRAASADFDHGANPAMQMYQRLTRNADGSLKRSFDANSAVSEIKNLRKSAQKAYKAGDNELGGANMDAAVSIENLLDRHMAKQGGGEAMADFRKARQQIAKSYDAEKALVGEGELNPQAYAKALAKGKPLSGGALEVAQAAEALPRSLQKPSPQATGATASDIGMMFLKGAGSGGLSWADPALIFARPAARSMIASRPYQNAFLRSGGLGGALEGSGPALPFGAYGGLANSRPPGSR